jgi:hypothetical protein
MLVTSFLAISAQAGFLSGVAVLLSYEKPPSKKQLEMDHPEGSEGILGLIGPRVPVSRTVR